nr:L,D-transpeptidase family protein [Desulfosporosinus orientis]
MEKSIEEGTKEECKKVLEELKGELKEKTYEETKDKIEEGIQENQKEAKAKESKFEVLKIHFKPLFKHKKVVTTVIFLGVLFLVYFGMTIYFMNHFYLGSKINNIDVSGKTVAAAISTLRSQLQDYTLNLKERDGKSERIKAAEVGLAFNLEDEIRYFKEGQNPFNWVAAIFNSKKSQKTIELSFDDKFLKDRIDRLTCFDSSHVVEPKNPSFLYTDKGYVIVNEVLGNKVNKDVLFSQVAKAIHMGLSELDLESSGAYIRPKYTCQSEEVAKNKELLNKYASAKITYTFGEGRASLDGSIINQWLTLDENYEVQLDENKVKEYINELSKTHSTVGKTRSFITSSGTTVAVGGGDYGWAIDTARETEDLILAVKRGQTITKEPTYSQKAFVLPNENNDIGNTYVEIDLSKQHVWFYKNGSLIVEGSVVSGNVSAGHSTPKGVYRLKYKQRNAILRGDDYAVPVSYWMPFNGGIGLHDANWRSAFGGNIYMINGSHGCINMPYNVAQAVFNNIDVYTPVVCY